MVERGLHVAHTTIMRWVQRYVPEFEKRWDGYARKTGRSWRVDETYVKVRGRWVYLYRAVDRDGNTVGCVAVRQEGGVQAISEGYLMKRASRTAGQRTEGFYPSTSSALS